MFFYLKALAFGSPNIEYKSFVNSDNYLVDMGANIDNTALYFWHYGMKVLAFEDYHIIYKIEKEKHIFKKRVNKLLL
ncbi:hypothetical protein MJ1_0586 [Nanobdella aerobiophila]|uniref:Uncharacterized protein n=1 Tax=Nanobdella aerobiophila TaxID=2586965 RepID=A0A915SL44_9ARCH|nr:hypothetical protein [Nanobdella aerobiophila]BBL45736.1 hypothetical protein MJ1_0586 [Nanobdella aerobiophila]